MNDLKDYTRLMLDHAKATIKRDLDSNRKEMEEVFANHLFRRPGPYRLSARLSRDQRLFSDLFFGFSEIFGSFNTLKDLSSLPVTGKKLSPSQYIRMNIEFYLAEIYMLQGRLLTYVAIIEKSARVASGGNVKLLRHTGPRLKKLVYKTFEPICGVRGEHVHKARYDDEDLRRVSGLELLVNPGALKELLPLYRRECRELRKKWRKIISTTLAETEAFLRIYFEVLCPIVFGKDKGILGPPSEDLSRGAT